MTEKISHALIVIGGDRPDPRALQHISQKTVVICADSGLDHALSLGLTPDIFLGDMDSVSSAALHTSQQATWKVITYDPLKDQTDTELALQYACTHGFTEITCYGVLAIASIMFLAFWQHSRINHSDQFTILLHGSAPIELK